MKQVFKILRNLTGLMLVVVFVGQAWALGFSCKTISSYQQGDHHSVSVQGEVTLAAEAISDFSCFYCLLDKTNPVSPFGWATQVKIQWDFPLGFSSDPLPSFSFLIPPPSRAPPIFS